ncbi:MAG: thioredoxin family protein [Bacteroidetes bacterium]|nr:thioredoxin family protein [Bacteroidota bacterium]
MLISKIKKIGVHGLGILFLLLSFNSQAQIEKPVTWAFNVVKEKAPNTYSLIFKASIAKGWHMYTQFIKDGGPNKLVFTFETKDGVKYKGGVQELSKSHKLYDQGFEMDVIQFEKEGIFKQTITLTKSINTIKGSLEFQVCDESKCLPPTAVDFDFNGFSFDPNAKEEVVPVKGNSEEIKKDSNTASITPEVTKKSTVETAKTKVETKVIDEEDEAKKSLWTIFIECLIGGFLALLTPCVYPMIPLTVGFFVKKHKTRAKGILDASIFGASIILIYIALGFLVTILVGKSNALNDLSTNIYFNLIFFVVFIFFAISFFGAFDLTLPSSWIDKTDKMGERGGLLGIFFVAFTLVLVSFSCTGPAVGPLLGLALKGGIKGPIVGMFGFSLAFSIPFTLFAVFPSMMKSLPKAGGWLNSVKVVFGFLELALALKFLSNVDLAYHWGMLKREYFLILWIVIFALMGFYLLGKIKFSHDSDLPFISIPRLFFVILTFSFTLYMIPGLWGAPVKLLSGLIPPDEYTEGAFMNSSTSPPPIITSSSKEKKYSSGMHCPQNLDCYFDYNQALEVAKATGKPLMLDFTGHGCANCRKMEANVWSDPKVLEQLKNDFVIVSLYVDDKQDLNPEDTFTSTYSHKQITTIGDRWSDFEVSKYNANTQPLYVLLDHNGEKMNKPVGYDADIDKFLHFLEEGKTEFKKRSSK